MSQHEQPPIDDPNLASYECPEYRAQLKAWLLLQDVYAGDLAESPRAKEYLPQEHCEPNAAYKVRLKRTPTDNRLQPAIEGFTGAISTLAFNDPEKFDNDFFENIDRRGNNLGVFLDGLDTGALLRRYDWVMVNKPDPVRPPRNRAEEKVLGTDPYLTVIKSTQVINWKIDGADGAEKVVLATIKEVHSAKDLKYGQESETLFRVVQTGFWQLIRVRKQNAEAGKWIEEIVEEGEYRDRSGAPVMPMIPYTLTSKRWEDPTERPPFLTVARLNVLLTQQFSDHETGKRMKNHAVPVFQVSKQARSGVLNDAGEVSLGNHDALFVGVDGDFKFSEPSGSALEINIQDMESTRQQIRARSLEFLTGEGSEKTATEIRLNILQVQNALARISKRKESAVNEILEILGSYTGQEYGTVSVSADLSVLLFTPEEIAASNAAGVLSLESAVKRLHQLGYNDDPEEELDRLKEEDAERIAALAKQMTPEPGQFDDNED